jgi:hypothetical protein
MSHPRRSQEVELEWEEGRSTADPLCHRAILQATHTFPPFPLAQLPAPLPRDCIAIRLLMLSQEQDPAIPPQRHPVDQKKKQ